MPPTLASRSRRCQHGVEFRSHIQAGEGELSFMLSPWGIENCHSWGVYWRRKGEVKKYHFMNVSLTICTGVAVWCSADETTIMCQLVLLKAV